MQHTECYVLNLKLTCHMQLKSVKNITELTDSLTLFPLMTHSDACAADDFWKHCDKRRNCSKRAISPFATMFSVDFSNYTFIYRDLPCFCMFVFKVVCWIFSVFSIFLHDFFQSRLLHIFLYLGKRLNKPLGLSAVLCIWINFKYANPKRLSLPLFSLKN